MCLKLLHRNRFSTRVQIQGESWKVVEGTNHLVQA
jgi:hypothetical protein